MLDCDHMRSVGMPPWRMYDHPTLQCAQMAAAAGTLDGILDTVSAKHDLGTYLSLLRTNGKMVLVGVPPEPYALGAGQLIFSECPGGECVSGLGLTGVGCVDGGGWAPSVVGTSVVGTHSAGATHSAVCRPSPPLGGNRASPPPASLCVPQSASWSRAPSSGASRKHRRC